MSATPILDLEIDPPKPGRSWLPYLIGGTFGAGLVAAFVTLPAGLPDLNGYLFIPALYVAIAAHEFGHLLAGKLAGMQSGGIAIGGFLVYKSGDRWIYRFDWRRVLAGGFAKPLPRNDEFRPAQFICMVAGGPFASLLLTAACGICVSHYGSGPAGWLGTLFWSAALTLTSLIPARSGPNKSDGALLWLLRMRPAESYAWIALLKIQTEETQGVQPADWDADLFEQMMAIFPSAPEYPYCELLACYRSADQKDSQGTAEHLEKALAASAKSGRIIRSCLFLEAASVSALGRHSAGNSRAWLDRARKLRKPESEEGALGGIAFCEGRYEEAARHFANALAWLEKRRLDSGLARFAKRKIAEYEKMCLQACEQPRSASAD